MKCKNCKDSRIVGVTRASKLSCEDWQIVPCSFCNNNILDNFWHRVEVRLEDWTRGKLPKSLWRALWA